MAAHAPLHQLIRECADAASAHGQATSGGDSKRANQAHDDPAVVAWAALTRGSSHRMKASAHLRSATTASLASTAEMTLSAWRDGELRFP
jgi:hypothetical protein